MKITTFLLLMIVVFTACTAIESESPVATIQSPLNTAKPDPSATPSSENSSQTPETLSISIPESEPTDKPIGTLDLKENQVEHGSDIEALAQVLSKIAFFTNDIVRVTRGGEALLDFGDNLRMRLFNDTEIQMVSAEIAHDVPWGVLFFLYQGGFAGQLTAEGGQAIYETPGGTEITILGTDYFIVYDMEGEETIAGNFEGTVEISSAGDNMTLPGGYFVVIPDGQTPNPPQPLPVSYPEFEQRARDLKSPILAADEVGEWVLIMSWEWLAFPEFERAIAAIEWTGKFHMEGDRIVGQGTGIILPRETGDDIITVKEGTFQFDITGEVQTEEDTQPMFILEIQGYDLDLILEEHGCDRDGYTTVCASTKAYMTRIFQVMAEELSTIIAPIIIDAKDGGTTTSEIDGSEVTYTLILARGEEELRQGVNLEPSFIDVLVTSASKQGN